MVFGEVLQGCNSVEEVFVRWTGILREKAHTYEHLARKRGDSVQEPTIDEICNEMIAFLWGLKAK